MSAPLVAGAAALILSINPSFTHKQIRDALQFTADTVGSYNYNWKPDRPGHSKELGYGRLNVCKALTLSPAMMILSSPSNGSIISFIGATTTVALRWNAAPFATGYSLQVDDDASFTSPLIFEVPYTDSTFSVITISRSTRYYWRVNAKNYCGTSPWSTVWSFYAVASPALYSPTNCATVSTSPNLSWSPLTGASSYRLQISTSSVNSR